MRNGHILKLIVGLINACLLNACTLFIQPSYVDISTSPKMQHLVGRCLELKQDVFLFQFSDTKTYALALAGTMSAVPSSIMEYQNDPLNWQYTDLNARKGQGPLQGYGKNDIIAVIPKGTKVNVVSIQEQRTLYDSLIKVIAYLDDVKYANVPVNLSFILGLKCEDILIPYPDEPELSTMGRELIPYPKPGVIEYCDDQL